MTEKAPAKPDQAPSQAQPPVDTSTTGRADGDTNKRSSSTAPPVETPSLNTPDELAQYDDMSLNELRSEAKKAGVEINYDVEKAFLVARLREAWYEGDDDDARPSENQDTRGKVPLYDLMSLDNLRRAAKDAKVPPFTSDQERAHLVTELKAHRTGAPPTAAPGKGATHRTAY